MKPNFALNFNHDSISLLHRTARGWLEIGVATLDAPDLDEALSYLRRSALGLSPGGITTKLVIPNPQILYDEIDAPGPDAATRRNQIRKALEGRSPYQVDDLAFDWQGTGPVVKIAVVARETLAEAEAFATRYRFNPVSFVAIPAPGSFGGEPWFGVSTLSASLLPNSETVERDQDPIVIVAREMPRAEPVAAAKPPTSKAKPEAAPPANTAAAAPTTVESASAVKPDVLAIATAKTRATSPTRSRQVAQTAATPKPQPDLPSAPTPAQPIQATSAPILSQKALAAQPTDPAHDHSGVPTIAAFSSRRSPVENTAPPPGALPLMAKLSADTVPPSAMSKTAPKPAPAALSSSALSLAEPQLRKAAAPAPPPRSDKAQGGQITAPGVPGSGMRPVKPTGAQTEVNSLAATMTTAPRPDTTTVGARAALPSRPALPRKKPRFLGLILTGVLLLLLTLVAAWSSYYLAGRPALPETELGQITPAPVTQQSAAVPESADQTVDLPAIEDEMLADQQDPADFAQETPVQDAGLAAGIAIVEPDPAPVIQAESAPPPSAPVPEPAPTPPSAALAQDNTAFGPMSEPQDEIFLATTDVPPATLDALALPRPGARPDTAPMAQLTPPPFGTLYEFDENGLIKPTAKGIITPEGILLVAGRPPLTPPARPVIAVAPAADPAADPASPVGIAPDQPFASDPALAGFRPRTRPANLTPPPSLQVEDDATLIPADAARFASLRPRARASASFALAESARLATQSASLSAPAAATPEPRVEAPNLASPLAIAVSRRPAARPDTFSKAVEAAVAAAIRQPETPRVPQAIQPEAEEEPEVIATAAPRIPTRASVAKNATFVNAINLSKTNLIGVYGTSSNRYALIRQSNGRYKKVKIGDKVDGGIVAAITSNELRYQKSGKIYALALPKS
ncbi:MAG: translation initiation factor 2 [Paracoccaceae bacterium]|nr:translation initiation factor 2 [Paracoccaceae bacterium]